MDPAARRRGVIYATLGAFGFSFKAILVKLAYPYGVDAVTLLALRMGFSLPFFLVMGVLGGRSAAAPVARKDVGTLIGLGFFGYYLASFLDFEGLSYITATLERLILFAYPTLVLVLSALFLGKPLTRRAMGALVLCYAGIALALQHDLGTTERSSHVLLGSALVFGSAMSYAFYLMGNGQIVGRVGAARVTAYATSVASVACLTHFAVTHPMSALVLPWQVYALSGAMALFCTVLPVWWVSSAIQELGAGVVSLIGTLGPVITIFLGWLILGEPLGLVQLVGAALVIAGVVSVAR